ncbi:unnamed protein product [Paramecium primaurelia]|uniref:Uncharacterized protein n=1 Tax=Paramecium primaurelia TaxID=5886 RepID=A0A8S1PCW8_PARPR|nr:unnamed protein product [Paramecium primaurelia]
MQFNENTKKFMTPEMMKQMSQMCANMSDDQLRQYAQMAGMGNVDPQFMRQQMGQVKNMRDEDLQRQVNQTRPEDIERAKQRMQGQQQQQQQQQQQKPQSEQFPIINKLKNQGNDAFKQQDYEKAASKYYEAISEIEELWENNSYLKNDTNKKIELKQLEHSCRLNYCNVKAKQLQFDVVLRQAKKVLEDDDQNGKANFRMGQALFETKKYQEALGYLEIASQKLPNDETVQIMYKQTKEQLTNVNLNVNQTQNQNKSDPQVQEQNIEQTQFVKQQEDQVNQNQQSQQIQNDKIENQDFQEEVQKKPKIKLSSVDTNSEEFQNLKQKVQSSKEDGFIVEEEIPTSKSQPNKPVTKQTETQNVNKIPENPQFQQQFDQFKNMSPEQLNYMTNTLKSMDKGFLKQMMKQQSGVEMSDQQIEMMQTMMTPEMLAQMKNIDPAVLQQQKLQQSQQQQQQQQQQPIQSTQQSNHQSAPQVPTSSQQMPQNLSGLAQNPQMLEMVIDQLKANPQMLKMMAPAFGGNNAITSYIDSASPEQLSKVVGRLAIFLKFLLMLYRAWLMVKNQWKFILGFLLAYLYFKLF